MMTIDIYDMLTETWLKMEGTSSDVLIKNDESSIGVGSNWEDLMVNGNGLFPKEFVFLSSC